MCRLNINFRDVTKISICPVNTTSRRGIKQLGVFWFYFSSIPRLLMTALNLLLNKARYVQLSSLSMVLLAEVDKTR